MTIFTWALWPQWLTVSLYFTSLLVHINYHDKPLTGKYNAVTKLFTIALSVWILHMGGFW